MGRSWLSIGLLVAGLSFQVAAIGCGDDDDDGGGQIAGQGGAGKGGTGGKAGTASAGKGGTGGGASTEQCVTQTKAAVQGSLTSACVECACGANASAFLSCDSDAHCWPLLACIKATCAADAADATAYMTCAAGAVAGACKDHKDAASSLMTLGPILTSTCAADCAVSGDTDAGTDAGE